MHAAIVSGIVVEFAPVSYYPWLIDLFTDTAAILN